MNPVRGALPRRLMAETTGPNGGKLDMLPVSLVYLQKNGMLDDVVSAEGTVRVKVVP